MEKLAEILNQELEVFNHFLNLLDQQHRQIIGRDIEELEKTNSELDKLTNQVVLLENKRMAEINNIKKDFDLDEDELKLRDILPHLDKKAGFSLRMLKESIMGAHKRVEEKSLRNKRLIERSRKVIAESMKLISSKPSPVYEKPGPGQPAIREGSLVNRSV